MYRLGGWNLCADDDTNILAKVAIEIHCAHFRATAGQKLMYCCVTQSKDRFRRWKEREFIHLKSTLFKPSRRSRCPSNSR
jgi:hypothetical protein